ncbi:MAG: hypothetical protein AAGC53_19785 [Actinomycetota bacterium]
MHVLGFWIFVGIVTRIGQSARLLVSLARDRDRSRALPWRYIRRRIRTDPGCVAAIVSITVSLVLVPSFALAGWLGAEIPWTLAVVYAGWGIAGIVMLSARYRRG